eukprot:TRINITY_DN19382_c0_g1_i1.p1 TRINITY_DN19382_c0_g1~~TRINITY_DN19382_c0_g1_i1.p1  ORF type:complete len:442 (-),score=63.30 TRINITY_DN19382_c0_g1_i1:72-1397(-)
MLADVVARWRSYERTKMAVAGPLVLYCSFVCTLLVNFFIYPAMLLSDLKVEEDTMRRSGLRCMVVVIILDLIWTNFHPDLVPLRFAGLAAAAAAFITCLHLLLAFRQFPWSSDGSGISYTSEAALLLQFLVGVCWIFVAQVGTAFVVRTNRPAARYQMMAWITVMVLGTTVTLLPQLRRNHVLIVAVAVLPRLAVAFALLAGGTESEEDRKLQSQVHSSTQQTDEQEKSIAVDVPRAVRFSFFACNGSIGEALNDMATDLQIRNALSAGDVTLTVSYNIAVMISMVGGLVFETKLAASPAARRFCSVLWGLCQTIRALGMQHLTTDRIGLMFFFVFFDKFTGPLGQASIDGALLLLLKQPRGDHSSGRFRQRIPANGMWTLRTAAERLERPLCQLCLLHFGAANAPPAVSLFFTAIAVCFVSHTFSSAEAHVAKQVDLKSD